MEQRLAEMERRLARAEQRSRLAGGVAALGVVAALVLAGARPAVTETEGTTIKAPFTVVDAQGKKLLAVTGGYGHTMLRLNYGDNKSGLIVNTNDICTRLSMFSAKSCLADLSASEEESSVLLATEKGATLLNAGKDGRLFVRVGNQAYRIPEQK